MQRAVVVSYRLGKPMREKYGFARLLDEDGNKVSGPDIMFHYNSICRVTTSNGEATLQPYRNGGDIEQLGSECPREPTVNDIIVVNDGSGKRSGGVGYWAYESDWLAAGGTL